MTDAGEAASPTPVQTAAFLTVGAAALMMSGLAPIVLGHLHRAGRLTAAEIGLCAMAELLTMGLVCGAAGAVLKPTRLRLIAVLACLAAASLDLLSAGLSHGALILARALAGSAEGVMLWVAIAMIAGRAAPERTAAVFLTSQVIGQFILTALVSSVIIPRFGTAGAYWAFGATALVGAVAGLLLCDKLTPASAESTQAEGLPPRRGWIALGAMFAFVAAGSGIYVYLDPIAQTSRLGPQVVAWAIQASLAAQILGGLAVTFAGNRVRYPVVFLTAAGVGVGVYLLYLAGTPALLFILATALTGFFGMVMGPFFVPMSIAADPGRRAAAMGGGAQILGGAGGPLAAAGVAGQPHAVIWLSIGWVVVGAGVATWLAITHRGEPVSG